MYNPLSLCLWRYVEFELKNGRVSHNRFRCESPYLADRFYAIM